jgi:hypothetical protein
MTDAIDPRAFGRLEQSVSHLDASVKALTQAVHELAERVGEIDQRYKVGKGAIVGALLVGVLAIYGVREFVDQLVATFVKP